VCVVPSEKRSRVRRKEQLADRLRLRGRPDADLRERLNELRAQRDKNLREISTRFGRRVEELYEEWAAERRAVWVEYDRRWERLVAAAGRDDHRRAVERAETAAAG